MKHIMKIVVILIVLFFAGCSANNQALHVPAGNGDIAKVKKALENGEDVNSQDIAGQTALMYASETGRIEIVKYLVQKGANVNAYSGRFGRGTALIYSASTGRLNVMNYLLDNGANINAVTVNNETALFYASAFGHIKAVELLLDRGANKEILNKDNKTALDIARQLNRAEVVSVLSGKAVKNIKPENIRKEEESNKFIPITDD